MTENFLRVGLLVIAGVILFLILFESWNKRRHIKMINLLDTPAPPRVDPVKYQNENFIEPQEPSLAPENSQPAEKKINDSATSDLIMMTVLAKPGNQFASYDLLQAILAAGFQFGEMNLFHYHMPLDDGGAKLFSLASTTKTGEFDMNNIGEFCCKGLILFLDLSQVIEPKKAFDLMLLKAQQLADDLEGELRADPHTPWSDNVLNQYQKKVLEKV